MCTMKHHETDGQKRLEGMKGGLFLIGLGMIWLMGLDFWPWILLVFGLLGLIDALGKGTLGGLLKGVLWIGGLVILFETNTLWPGILILIGMSIILDVVFLPSTIKRRQSRGKRKAKRDWIDDEDDYETEYAYADGDYDVD